MSKPSPALGVSLFIFLFFIKTVILAFWVTPMWDIPDETGHLAYTIELATTYKLPVMGESIIDWYIMETVQESNFAPELFNTISQHPPVYYLFTAPMWKAGTLITDHRDLLFRTPRLVASFAGCLTLLFVYRLMLLLTRRVSISFGAMALISFIPMFTHLSAGVNNDIMTMMFSTIAVFYWARYSLERKFMDVWLAMGMLSLGACTKITVLVLIPPMFLFTVLQLEKTKPLPWLKQCFILGVTCSALPGLWLLRTYLVYGHPLMAWAGLKKQWEVQIPLEESLYTYMTRFPLVEHLHIHFFGLFGWLGSGMLQIQNQALQSYNLILLTLAAAAFLWLFLDMADWNCSDSPNIKTVPPAGSRKTFRILWAVSSAGIFLASTLWNPVFSDELLLRVIYSLFVSCGILALGGLIIRPGNRHTTLVYASLVISAFFMMVAVWKLYGVYIQQHRFGAIHGRYFFPLIPLGVIGILYPATRLIRGRILPVIVLVTVAGIAELGTFLLQVFPHYRQF